MPITHAAKKALRQSRSREARNALVKRAMKEAVKSLRKAVDSKDAEKIKSFLPAAYKKIDKAAKIGLLHKNTAARRKSRLAKLARETSK